MIQKSNIKNIFITGAHGMLGSALKTLLENEGHNVYAPTSQEVNLLNKLYEINLFL